MQVRHSLTQREHTLEAGDIVRALGATKSVSIGRVVDIDRSHPSQDKAIVFWYGVGTGSGWLASDLEVLQTAHEHAELLDVGARKVVASMTPERRAEVYCSATHLGAEHLNRDERVLILAVARELRVRHLDLLRVVRVRLMEKQP